MAKKKTGKAMKAARAMKAMKAVKAMKVKRTTRVGSKREVLLGRKEKTKAGLKKADFVKNKEGKYVSKKRSAMGKRHYANIAPWISACKKARQDLCLSGFVPVKKGSALYDKARELLQA